MDHTLLSVLSILPLLLRFTFFFAVVVILVRLRRNHRRPANYALAAISLQLIIATLFPLVQYVGVRYLTQQNIAVAFGMLNLFSTLFSTLISIGSFTLILVAVFIERDVSENPRSIESPLSPGNDMSGKPLENQPSENPYVAPRL